MSELETLLTSTRLDNLEKKVHDSLSTMELAQEATNQHLKDAMAQFQNLGDLYHDTISLVGWLRRRLAILLPEPKNCEKCGAKLVKASRKCACGKQN